MLTLTIHAIPHPNSLSDTPPFFRLVQWSHEAIPSVIHIRWTFIPHTASGQRQCINQPPPSHDIAILSLLHLPSLPPFPSLPPPPPQLLHFIPCLMNPHRNRPHITPSSLLPLSVPTPLPPFPFPLLLPSFLPSFPPHSCTLFLVS